MVVKILKKFHDKADYAKVYLVGETLTLDDARAESLIARGLAECAETLFEPEVELAEEQPKPEVEPEKPVSKVQPIVKQGRKKQTPKGN